MALLVVGSVVGGAGSGCSLMLIEESAQCSTDNDCSARGFGQARCDVSTGVCLPSTVAPNGGSGGGTSGGGGSSGSGGIDGSGASGGSGGDGSGGGIVIAEPSGVRLLNDSLSPIQDSNSAKVGTFIKPFVDTCPRDQVAVGFRLWTEEANKWIWRVQVICGELVLTPDGSGYTIEVAEGADLDVRGDGHVNDTAHPALCEPNEVVVGFDGRAGLFIDNVRIYCAPLHVTGGPGAYSIQIDLPEPRQSVGGLGGEAFGLRECPPGQIGRGGYVQLAQPDNFPVAVGAFTLVCGRPGLVVPEGASCSAPEQCATGNCTATTCGPSNCNAPEGCTCEQFNRSSYLFCEDAQSWEDAASTCADADRHLVRIEKDTKNGWLRSTANLRAVESLWTGAHLTDDVWSWTGDDEPFWQGGSAGSSIDGRYETWASSQPNNAQKCGSLSLNSRWTARDCADTLAFVCE